MFNYLRNDLRKYKDVYQQSLENETIYSPLTPTHRFTQEELETLPKTDEGIVDLRSIMAEYDQPFKKKYEEIIDNLKAENKELKQHEQKVNN